MRQALLSALLVSALFAAAPALAQSDTPQAAPQAEQPSHNDPNLRGRDRILNELFERLAKADPNNAGWQRDLSVSYAKVGDVQVAQGDLAGALKSFTYCS